MKTVVFYDNQCSVCNYWVNWILENDKKQIFYFAALESDFAIQFSDHSIYKFPPETIVVWEDSIGFLEKSDAVIFILESLSPSSFQLKALKLFPKIIRDYGYSVFAYFRRYLQIKECKLPSIEDRKRFLTDHSLQNFLNK